MSTAPFSVSPFFTLMRPTSALCAAATARFSEDFRPPYTLATDSNKGPLRLDKVVGPKPVLAIAHIAAVERLVELHQLLPVGQLYEQLKVLMTHEVLVEPSDLLEERPAHHERSSREVRNDEHYVFVDVAVGMLGKDADELIAPVAFHATGDHAPLVGKRGESFNLTSDLLRLPPVIIVQECQQLAGGRLDAPVSSESPVLMDGGFQQAHSTIDFGERANDVSNDRSKPPFVTIVVHYDKLKVL